MRSWPAAIALVAVVLPASASASPELGDFSMLRYDLTMVSGSVLWNLERAQEFIGPLTIEDQARLELFEETAGQVGLTLLFLRAFADPWIEYELTVQNSSDQPLEGTLQIILDTSVFDESWSAHQTLSVELVDTNADGASLTPNQFATIQSVAPAIHLLTPLELFLLNLDGPVFLGDGVGQAGTTDFEAGPYAMPAVNPDLQAGNLWNALIVTVDFRLSPFDEATLSGGIVVTPEPSTVFLLAAGLAACAVLRRARAS